jgi:predicted nucleic acid-binding Zn ribbon protein
MDDDLPRPVGDSLDRLTEQLGAPRSSALHAVFMRWSELVGPAIAEHAHPLSLKTGTLTVGVDQPGWATQLRYLEATLLASLAASVGPEEVRRIEVRVVRSA